MSCVEAKRWRELRVFVQESLDKVRAWMAVVRGYIYLFWSGGFLVLLLARKFAGPRLLAFSGGKKYGNCKFVGVREKQREKCLLKCDLFKILN